MAVTPNLSKRQKAAMKAEAVDTRQTLPNLDSIRRSLPSGRQSLPSGYRYALFAVDDKGNILPGSEQAQAPLDLDVVRFGNQLEQKQRRSDRVSEQAASITETQPEEPLCDAVSVAATSVKTGGRRTRPEHGRQRRRANPARTTTPAPTRSSSSPEEIMPIVVATPEPRVTMALQPQKQMKSFRINDTAAVVDFLSSRLKRMQQLADKKIAKAWIKGICPKKQAKFPYQNNKQEKIDGRKPEVPGWWPEIEVCRFVEPDHIRREERMGLCLHLLRLRPTPDQLEQWNKHDFVASKTHQRHGWTMWLGELAGPEVFEELSKDADHRVKHRQKLMEQMYEVARMEEAYLEDEIDEDSIYQYEDEEEESRTMTSKRARRTSSAAESTPDCDEPMPRSRSSSCNRTVAKRAKRESVVTSAPVMERCASDQKPDLEMLDVQSVVPLVADQSRSAASSFSGSFVGTPRNSISCDKVDNIVQTSQPDQPRQLHHMHGLPRHNGSPNTSSHGYSQAPPPPPHQWHDHSRPVSSEQQQQVGSDFQFQAQTAPYTFPGRQDFEFPQYQPQYNTQIHMGYIPQTEFQSTPGTPVFSSAGMASIPMDTFSLQQQCGVTTDQQYQPMMAPSHYFEPAYHMDTTVSNFQAPVQMTVPGYQQPYQQEPAVLAQRHIAPMQNMQPQYNHGMPMPQQPVQYHHHNRR